MFMGLNSHSNAKGPDFDKSTEHSFELSSTKLSIRLPGKLDKDFPAYEGLYKINIYDNDKYNGHYYEQAPLLERHWDYKGYFWQGLAGRFASMSLYVSLNKLPDNSPINLLKSISPLEEIIREVTYLELDVERKINIIV